MACRARAPAPVLYRVLYRVLFRDLDPGLDLGLVLLSGLGVFVICVFQGLRCEMLKGFRLRAHVSFYL